MNFAQVAELCAPAVAPGMLKRIASVESSYNPYAIGIVGGRLVRQPSNSAEALATVNALKAQGWDYSVGLVQVNQKNFGKYGLTAETAFDPCTNLRVGSQILADCYRRAGGTVTRTGDALSCYYAGDFRTGYRLGYVAKVEGAGPATALTSKVEPIPVIANTHSRHSRAPVRALSVTAPSALFVSTPARPLESAGQNDLSPTSQAVLTALLF